MFTARAVAQRVIDLTGQKPVEVDIMNDRSAVVQMEPKNLVVHVAQALHNAQIWDEQTGDHLPAIIKAECYQRGA